MEVAPRCSMWCQVCQQRSSEIRVLSNPGWTAGWAGCHRRSAIQEYNTTISVHACQWIYKQLALLYACKDQAEINHTTYLHLRTMTEWCYFEMSIVGSRWADEEVGNELWFYHQGPGEVFEDVACDAGMFVERCGSQVIAFSEVADNLRNLSFVLEVPENSTTAGKTITRLQWAAAFGITLGAQEQK